MSSCEDSVYAALTRLDVSVIETRAMCISPYAGGAPTLRTTLTRRGVNFSSHSCGMLAKTNSDARRLTSWF